MVFVSQHVTAKLTFEMVSGTADEWVENVEVPLPQLQLLDPRLQTNKHNNMVSEAWPS